MALRCCHVGCDDEESFLDRCEYELEVERLARWLELPYSDLFKNIDESQARRMIEAILGCYRGAPPVR